MKYLETGSCDPYYNLAFEEYMLLNFKDDDYLILWQNDNTIVFGVNQNPIAEINMNEAEKYNINIVRRSTGGGTVYHDLGNINFSYITDWNDGDNRTYEFFLTPVVEALSSFGLEIEIKGRNDMLLDGKKISGSAQRLAENRILHHGTLLINSDLNMLQKVLNVKADKISSKGIKSVKSRVTNLQDNTSEILQIESVKSALINSFAKSQNVNHIHLEKEDIDNISSLAENKYRSWEWTYAKSADCQLTKYRRFDGGNVQLDLDINNGSIDKCVISGDFLSLKDVRELEEKIQGRRYSYEELARMFNDVDMKLYFGNIKKEEILELFF